MLPLLLAFRKHFEGSDSDDYGYIADFGFYAGGLLSMTWESMDFAVDLQILLLNYSSFVSWRTARRSADDWHNCAPVPSAIANWSILLNGSEAFTFSIPKSAVYYLIVAECSKGVYKVDAFFTNPNGQLLDSRYVPLLTIVPIMIGIFCVVLLYWIFVLGFRCESWTGPRIFLSIVIFCQIAWLVATEVDFGLRSRDDSCESVTDPPRLAMQSLATWLFFTILVFTAGGFGIVRVRWGWIRIVMQVGMSALYVGMTLFFYFWTQEVNAQEVVWMAIVAGCLQMGSVVVLAVLIWRNYVEVTNRLNAHLLVIRMRGIRPPSTPVYADLKLYVCGLLITLCALLIGVVTTMLWFWIVGWWIGHLVQEILVLVSCAALIWLVRPRESAFYLRDIDTREERVVQLKDLEAFVPTDVTAEMREWCPGMRLPPEPRLVVNAVDAPSQSDYVPEWGPSGRMGLFVDDKGSHSGTTAVHVPLITKSEPI
jgi:hypothetical protein